MSNFIISKMSIKDLDSIKDILSDFDDFWNYEVLKDELTSPSSMYIVAKNEDNVIVGFAGIKIIFNEAEIMNIVTKKDVRNQGIGTLLLEELINFCKTNKFNLINLEVNVKNTIAINLYKKYNFNEVGLRKKYYNNTDDALLFTLKL